MPRPNGWQFNGKRTTSTANDGSFNFDLIQPGSYALLANLSRKDNVKPTFAPTCFPNSLSDSGAAPITLQLGDNEFGLILQVELRCTHTVTGSARSSVRKRKNVLAAFAANPVRSPLSEAFSRILFAPYGQFQIEGVFSGSYDLILKSKLAFTRQLALSFEVPDRDITGLKVD